MYNVSEIKRIDPEIAHLINQESDRQRDRIELIASENFVSKAVMAAMGSCLTNKYAEGLPGKRYYGGCQYVDLVEELAIERTKRLFGVDHANVQPHSGAQANMAVFFAMLKPGDTILGMDLAHGGHLTHGSPVNMSGKYFNVVSYGVTKETGRIDYDKMRELALQHRPKMIVVGASAYPREIDYKPFGEVAKEIGAYLMADIAHISGLIATGHHQSPVPYADFVTTTTHKTLRGPRGGLIMCKAEFAKAVDKAVFPGIQGGPLMHVIAAKAVALKEAATTAYTDYCGKVLANAKALSGRLIENGFDLVSGGTDNHLMLVDTRKFNVTGKEMENRLGEVGITCNKNAIPFDPQPPNTTSGIRLGTPAMTTRGLNTVQMTEIADIITLVASDFDANKEKAAAKVKELLSSCDEVGFSIAN